MMMDTKTIQELIADHLDVEMMERNKVNFTLAGALALTGILNELSRLNDNIESIMRTRISGSGVPLQSIQIFDLSRET